MKKPEFYLDQAAKTWGYKSFEYFIETAAVESSTYFIQNMITQGMREYGAAIKHELHRVIEESISFNNDSDKSDFIIEIMNEVKI